MFALGASSRAICPADDLCRMDCRLRGAGTGWVVRSLANKQDQWRMVWTDGATGARNERGGHRPRLTMRRSGAASKIPVASSGSGVVVFPRPRTGGRIPAVGRARAVLRRVLAEVAACGDRSVLDGKPHWLVEWKPEKHGRIPARRSGGRSGCNPEVTVRGAKESRRCAAEATEARQGKGSCGVSPQRGERRTK